MDDTIESGLREAILFIRIGDSIYRKLMSRSIENNGGVGMAFAVPSAMICTSPIID